MSHELPPEGEANAPEGGLSNPESDVGPRTGTVEDGFDADAEPDTERTLEWARDAAAQAVDAHEGWTPSAMTEAAYRPSSIPPPQESGVFATVPMEQARNAYAAALVDDVEDFSGEDFPGEEPRVSLPPPSERFSSVDHAFSPSDDDEPFTSPFTEDGFSSWVARCRELASSIREVDRRPGDMDARCRLAEARLAVGSRSGAENECTEALQRDPEHAEAWFLRAEIRLDAEEIDGALEDVQQGLTRRPRSVRGHILCGRVELAAGRPDRAVAAYDLALYLAPERTDLFKRRAEARAAAGDVSGAIEDYTIAIGTEPHDAEALLHRSLLRARAGRAGAATDFRRAIIARERSATPTELPPTSVRGRSIAGALEATIDELLQDAPKID